MFFAINLVFSVLTYRLSFLSVTKSVPWTSVVVLIMMISIG